ncbi:hypothetical protein I3843_09G021300 [Carya illinoinensis]|uniref:Uncharacterized protein n=1 Tax=Carya illinoinensis TaxID=32201 RepID=A0A922J585_CARIL|nr:hypothetical protein I3842_09G021200 [Carya illinoinensis]KAG7961520.1 hypothetical protein I3843_09G021300 [Carya illinoinensis]
MMTLSSVLFGAVEWFCPLPQSKLYEHYFLYETAQGAMLYPQHLKRTSLLFITLLLLFITIQYFIITFHLLFYYYSQHTSTLLNTQIHVLHFKSFFDVQHSLLSCPFFSSRPFIFPCFQGNETVVPSRTGDQLTRDGVVRL